MEPIDLVVENHDHQYQATAKGLLLSSTSLLGSTALYNEEYRCHVHTVLIGKDSSYHIKPYTITEGPMKGFQALVLVPSGFFRLLDLPTEVRDMVYEKVFAEGTTKLKLHTNKHKDPVVSKVVGVEYDLRGKAWKEKRKWNEQLEKWVDKDRRTALSLLQVNKQIYNEAFKVLYRSRAFRFEGSGALSRFFELNERSAQYLTRIMLSVSCDIEQGLEVLAKSRPKSLQRVVISHKSLNKTDLRRTAKEIFRISCQVLDAVYLARQKKGISVGMEDLLRLGHSDCAKGDERRECREIGKQLSKLIKEEYPMKTGRGEKGVCGTE